MAIWQFDFIIIPRGTIEEYYDENRVVFWDNVRINQTEKFFKGILKISKGWDNDVLIYGDNDKTCIKILKENNVPVEISCRIDLRDLSEYILKKIIEYINLIEGSIYYNGKIYTPTINTLIELIKKSEENNYCKNPIGYIKSLDSQNY